MGRDFYSAVDANPSMAICDAELDICYLSFHLYEEKFGEIPPSDISRESNSNADGWADGSTTPSVSDEHAIRELICLWNETRLWAERLICSGLGLQSPEQILEKPHRGKHQVSGTMWFYRTHGGGVDIFQEGNVGGIDFDFAVEGPDPWRLRIFLVKQYNAGALRKRIYRPLLQDRQRWEKAVDTVLNPESVNRLL